MLRKPSSVYHGDWLAQSVHAPCPGTGSARQFFLVISLLYLCVCLCTIAGNAAEVAPGPTWIWNHEGGFTGWKLQGAVISPPTAAGLLTADARSAVATVLGPAVRFPASGAPALRLVARVRASVIADLVWTADGRGGSHRFLLTGGWQWNTYTLPPRAREGWTGTVTQVGLRLVNAAGNRLELAALETLREANEVPSLLVPDPADGSRPACWRRNGKQWEVHLHSLRPRSTYRVAGDLTLTFKDADGATLPADVDLAAGAGANVVVPWGAATTLVRATSLEEARTASVVLVRSGALEGGAEEREAWRASWIWHPEPPAPGTRYFRRTFDAGAAPEYGRLLITASGGCRAWLNGAELGVNEAWQTPSSLDLSPHLKPGVNVLAVTAANTGKDAGLLAEAWVRSGQDWQTITTDAGWRSSTAESPEWRTAASPSGEWVPVDVLGPVPLAPWGQVTYAFPGPRSSAKVEGASVAWDAAARAVRYTVRVSASETRVLRLQVRARNSLLAERALGAVGPLKEQEFTGTVPLPFAPEGEAAVVVDSPYTILQNARIGSVPIPPVAPGELPQTRLLRSPNGPVLEIDGFRTPPHMYVAPAPMSAAPEAYARHVADIAAAGIHLHSADLRIDGKTWSGPSRFDFSALDGTFGTILGADSDARLLLRVELDAPDWWVRDHPGDQRLNEKGLRDTLHPLWERQSLGSEAWQRDARALLVALGAYLRHCAYAPRVWGVLFCTSGAIEWIENTNAANPVDFGPAGVQGWRKWLRAQYGSDEELRRAWHAPAVTLEGAAVPPAAVRNAAEAGDFRDPARGAQPAIDYARYVSSRIVDLMLDGARALKEGSDGRLAVGVYYGYQVYGSLIYGFLHQSGHGALERALQSPDLMFFVSPVGYYTRFPGMAGMPMAPAAAAEQHGKLWIQEEDLRTYLETSEAEYGNGRVDTLYDSIHAMRREFGTALCSGWGLWWYEMFGVWLRNPALRTEIRRMRAAHTSPARAAATPRAQIAVVLDEGSLPYLRNYRGNTPGRALVHDQIDALYRVGAPFDLVLLSDLLPGGKAPDYRLYLFLNSWKVAPEAREALHARLKRDKATAVWEWAAGLFPGDKSSPSLEAARALTGFHLEDQGKARLPEAPHPLQRLEDVPLVRGLSPEQFGSPASQSTLLLPSDGIALGRLGDSRVALAMKAQDGWKSIYLATPGLPAAFLRRLAVERGIPIYSASNDVLTAGGGFLMLHADRGGRKVLTLPTAAEVWDPLRNRRLSPVTARYECVMEAGETRLFSLRGGK